MSLQEEYDGALKEIGKWKARAEKFYRELCSASAEGARLTAALQDIADSELSSGGQLRQTARQALSTVDDGRTHICTPDILNEATGRYICETCNKVLPASDGQCDHVGNPIYNMPTGNVLCPKCGEVLLLNESASNEQSSIERGQEQLKSTLDAISELAEDIDVDKLFASGKQTPEDRHLNRNTPDPLYDENGIRNEYIDGCGCSACRFAKDAGKPVSNERTEPKGSPDAWVPRQGPLLPEEAG